MYTPTRALLLRLHYSETEVSQHFEIQLRKGNAPHMKERPLVKITAKNNGNMTGNKSERDMVLVHCTSPQCVLSVFSWYGSYSLDKNSK